MQRIGIGERGISIEYPFQHRIEETAFKLVRRARNFKRERGEYPQRDRGVFHCPRDQRIGKMIGFAKTERQCQHNGLADLCNDCVGKRSGVVRYPGGPGHEIFSCLRGTGR